MGGIKAFVRRGLPETTLVDDEQGKFICPTGGAFLIFLSNPETPELAAAGRIASVGGKSQSVIRRLVSG